MQDPISHATLFAFERPLLRQKLPLAGLSNFRFTPKSSLNLDVVTGPKSANSGSLAAPTRSTDPPQPSTAKTT
jgi:hypothetical protein